MKIVYFPGFGGSEKSNTFLKILSIYPDSQAIIYNNTNADKAFFEIENQLKNVSTEINLIIGQSLGGFWAEYFAIKHNKKLILINPSFEPFKSLSKYNVSPKELNSFKKFRIVEKTSAPISIILSKNDTVVDPKPVLEKYNTLKFKYVEGDHIFTHYDFLLKEIDLILK